MNLRKAALRKILEGMFGYKRLVAQEPAQVPKHLLKSYNEDSNHALAIYPQVADNFRKTINFVFWGWIDCLDDTSG